MDTILQDYGYILYSSTTVGIIHLTYIAFCLFYRNYALCLISCHETLMSCQAVCMEPGCIGLHASSNHLMLNHGWRIVTMEGRKATAN